MSALSHAIREVAQVDGPLYVEEALYDVLATFPGVTDDERHAYSQALQLASRIVNGKRHAAAFAAVTV